jgi:hypothetical protein
MADEPTCGKGLAEHAPLPTLLGRLMQAVGRVLEVHTAGLVLDDPHSAHERDVYLMLVREHNEAASELTAIGERMATYRDLPMGAHNIEALSTPEAAQAFQSFVDLEDELVALLQKRLKEDRAMLDAMRQE